MEVQVLRPAGNEDQPLHEEAPQAARSGTRPGCFQAPKDSRCLPGPPDAPEGLCRRSYGGRVLAFLRNLAPGRLPVPRMPCVEMQGPDLSKLHGDQLTWALHAENRTVLAVLVSRVNGLYWILAGGLGVLTTILSYLLMHGG